MPLETATHISGLVASNPASSDGLNQADDHMRLMKQVLLTDIGGSMTNGALTAVDGTSTAPSIGFASDATAGFYRKGTGVLGLTGRLYDASEVGSLHMFLVEPTGLGKAGTGTGYRFLELDGSTWPNSAFPELAAHLGQGGTTFTLPNAYATGRFPRSRTATVAAGVAQANTVGPHTHPDVTATTGNISADHSHTYSGNTGIDGPDHTHNTSLGVNNGVGGGSTFVAYSAYAVAGSGTTSSTSTVTSGGPNSRHTHAFSGTTSGVSSNHTHNVTVSTPANTGTTETRPEALSVVLCIKA
jgi:hypothetical protein